MTTAFEFPVEVAAASRQACVRVMIQAVTMAKTRPRSKVPRYRQTASAKPAPDTTGIAAGDEKINDLGRTANPIPVCSHDKS
jgi:hypothetical protein